MIDNQNFEKGYHLIMNPVRPTAKMHKVTCLICMRSSRFSISFMKITQSMIWNFLCSLPILEGEI